jgi:hypothetical protein
MLSAVPTGCSHPLLVRIDAELSIRVLVIAVRHEFIVDGLVYTTLLHVGWWLDRVLDLTLASLLFTSSLYLCRESAPLAEETRHILHPVVRIEQGGHGVE